MKILISEETFEKLAQYKSGNMQKVYTSTDDNILIKTPKQGFYTDKEIKLYELMQANPSVFAKIYKIEPHEVWQEKLDESKFNEQLHEVYLEFDKSSYFDWIPSNFYQNKTEWNDAMIYAVMRDSNGEDFKRCMVGLEQNLFSFLKELMQVITKIKSLESPELEFDIHSQQFGYDKKGKIKCFDI